MCYSIIYIIIIFIFQEKFGSIFTYDRQWGFSRVGEMFLKLPELCHVDLSDNEIKIISVKKYMSYEHNVSEEEEEEDEEEISGEVFYILFF